MTKRTLIIILVFSFLTLLVLKFIGYYNKEDNGFVGFFGRLLNKTNSFNVTYTNVDKKDVDILWETEWNPIDTLVLDGNLMSNFGYEYGREKFIVIYRGKTISTDGFMSTNNNDVHDVEINISKVKDSLEITYLIDKQKTITRINSDRQN